MAPPRGVQQESQQVTTDGETEAQKVVGPVRHAVRHGVEKQACLRSCSRAGHSGSAPWPSHPFTPLGMQSLWAELSRPITLFAWPRDGGCLQDPRTLYAHCTSRGWRTRLRGLDCGVGRGGAACAQGLGFPALLRLLAKPPVRIGVGFRGPGAPLKSGDAIPRIPGHPREPPGVWVTPFPSETLPGRSRPG